MEYFITTFSQPSRSTQRWFTAFLERFESGILSPSKTAFVASLFDLLHKGIQITSLFVAVVWGLLAVFFDQCSVEDSAALRGLV